MPVHITVDRTVEWGANRWLDHYYPDISAQRKERILPVTKYNLLVKTFNISTILLTTAVALACLFAYSAAVSIGAIGLFGRITVEKELNSYGLALPEPYIPQGGGLLNVVRGAIDVGALVRHALNLVSGEEKEANIVQRLGIGKPEGWVENEVFVFGHAVWKNSLPVPNQ